MKKAKPVKKQEAPKSVEAIDYLARMGLVLLVLAAFGYGFYSSYNSNAKPEVKAGKCYSNVVGGDIVASVDYMYLSRDAVYYYYSDLASLDSGSKTRTLNDFRFIYPDEVPCALYDTNKALVKKLQRIADDADRSANKVIDLQVETADQAKRLRKLERKNGPSKH